MRDIMIKKLTTIDELNEMAKIEKAVWHMSSTLPFHQTFTALNNGGIILGAYDEDQMIGFLYSFPGFDGKNAYVCSHMLGILPEYRKGGLGEEMKLKQAEIAKDLGYERITWTFDPLESVNAYLNLHKLGAKGAFYKENYYGTLQDDFSQGLPSDRIHILWDLESDGHKPNYTFTESNILLNSTDGAPVITDTFHTTFKEKEDVWFMAIPINFQELKKENFELAKEWRHQTRSLFQTLFEQGYQAIDMIPDLNHNRSYYVFAK